MYLTSRKKLHSYNMMNNTDEGQELVPRLR